MKNHPERCFIKCLLTARSGYWIFSKLIISYLKKTSPLAMKSGEVKFLMITHQVDKGYVCNARHRNTRLKGYGNFNLQSIVGTTYTLRFKTTRGRLLIYLLLFRYGHPITLVIYNSLSIFIADNWFETIRKSKLIYLYDNHLIIEIRTAHNKMKILISLIKSMDYHPFVYKNKMK